jgi:hypothetical protein
MVLLPTVLFKMRALNRISFFSCVLVLVIGLFNLKSMMDSTFIGSVHSHNNNDKGDTKKKIAHSMPIVGKKYEIFQPLYDMDSSKMNSRLFLPSKDLLDIFEERISWARSMVKIFVSVVLLLICIREICMSQLLSSLSPL